MKVKEIMNKSIVAESNIKGKDAVKIMAQHNIGSLVITNKDKIVGIVTERDILKNINKLNEKISNIMSKNVICIDENESIERAAFIMKEKKIKRLPVTRNNKLVGIITATDLIANAEELNEPFFFD